MAEADPFCQFAANEALAPLRLPLRGARLIEASAGTGKTYTLALLYLRLILGHGGKEAAFARPLMPPEILVITFTRAATEEIRERIRHRLVEAAEFFQGECQTQTSGLDPLLIRLCTEMPEGDRAYCAQRLRLAAQWMDEAAILTIHAWCYRMLREHGMGLGTAFAAAAALGPQLENEAHALTQQAAEDYWRIFVLGLDADLLPILLDRWRDPQALANEIRPLLSLIDELQPPPNESPQLILKGWVSIWRAQLEQIKSEWRQQGYVADLRDLFAEAARAKSFDQQRLNRNHREQVLNALAAWLADPEQEKPAIFANKSWERMSSRAVREIWHDRDQAPIDHSACRALAELQERLAALPPKPFPNLLLHAAHWIWGRIERDKQRLGLLTQQDLLVQLARALQGPWGSQLAALIRRQFPAVMVDEFQDTDPLQYRILDAIYDLRANDPTTCLLMVGDPKQAIYGFRGADIHAYLRARIATQGRHFTLKTNYRATPKLIEAVNALFTLGEGRAQGAFLLGDALPFVSANAGTAPERLFKLRDQPHPPLSAWIIEPEETRANLSKGDYRARSAEIAARQIAELLRLGRMGQALLPGDPDGWRPLAASDLSVLVNNMQEAEVMRQALRSLGIPSVYLSERQSVFATWVAAELLIVLRAIANPFDDGLLRQALASRLLGRSLADLDRLNRDELMWERECEGLRALHLRWQQQGLLPMLYRLINVFGIAARLLATQTGERDLTDLLHLGELLHQASLELDGEQALLRFFAEAIADCDSADTPESYQLRLENDAELVRIVTIHKSKGLQYPLVLLPFVADCRPITEAKPPILIHDADHRRRVQLIAEEHNLTQLDQERLGEDLRKLYVALTRAQYAVWLGLGMISDLRRSAIGYLLGVSQETAPADLSRILAQLPGLNLLETERSAQLGYDTPGSPPLTPPESLGQARTLRHWHWHPWWISSYSALRAQTDHGDPQDLGLPTRAEHPGQAGLSPGLLSFGPGPIQVAEPDAPETAGEELAREEGTGDQGLAGTVDWEGTPLIPADRIHGITPRGSAGIRSLHDFPRGGRYGTFLHGLLEWAAIQGFAAARNDPETRLQLIARRCAHRRLNDWTQMLDHWLCGMLDRHWSLDRLEVPPLRLVDLQPEQYQVELEFWLEAQTCDPRVFDRWISQSILPGQARSLVNGTLLNGMLKGFIDLAFVHQGRYYVLDWKSNWLGPDDSAYTQEAMRAAILEHRYDLQAVIYLLALHRQLRARLADYDYERHLGGAIYVFVRGAESPTQGLFMERPPYTLIEALDLLLAGEKGHAGS